MINLSYISTQKRNALIDTLTVGTDLNRREKNGKTKIHSFKDLSTKGMSRDL
jgi:hypothetical protein